MSVHGLATEDYFDLGCEDNCYKSMRILSVLYNSVVASIYPDMIGKIMNLRILESFHSQRAAHYGTK